jgi:hypothetical protein
MSLTQLLAEHSRDISANLAHTQEMAQDNVDRKANDLEEKFQHAKDSIEGLGGEIAAGGAAYHMGRKIYTKYQEKYGNRQAQRQVPEEERTGFGNQPGDEPKNTGSSDGAAQSEEGRSASGNGGTDSGEGGEQPEAKPTTTDAEADPSVGAAADDDVAPVKDSPISDADESVAKQLDDAYPNSGMGDDYRQAAQSQANRNAQLQQQQQQKESDSKPVSEEQASPDEATQGGTRQAAQTGADEAESAHQSGGASEAADEGQTLEPSDIRADMSQGKGSATSDLGNDGASAGADTGDVSASLGGDVAADADGIGARALGSLTSTGLEAGLDTASAVLDALGPIGEGIGVITSLVGLFEGLHHHKKDVNEQSDIGGANAGVDTSALQQTSSVGVVA